MDNGRRFIRSIQRPDGSWYGSWGVCFTYGERRLFFFWGGGASITASGLFRLFAGEEDLGERQLSVKREMRRGE